MSVNEPSAGTPATRTTIPWSSTSAGAAMPARADREDGHTDLVSPKSAEASSSLHHLTMRINGRVFHVSVDSRTTLLDAIRDHAGLTGTKKGCGHGQCGACTVLADGTRMLSCMTFAVMAEEREITTIEGLSKPGGELHPMQQAFVDHDAFQCGYCTPGQILSAIGCVEEGCASSADDIREYMSGNICRCAAYPNIVSAIEQARDVMKKNRS